MNLFGINISFRKNEKWVKQDECHAAQDRIHHRIGEVKDFLNIRLEDMCKKIDLVVTLLNGKK